MSDSYTMAIEEDITPLAKTIKASMSIPAEYRYNACPRCKGTCYSAATVTTFHCMVCGWHQKCNRCFGDVKVSGNGTYCVSCNSSNIARGTPTSTYSKYS